MSKTTGVKAAKAAKAANVESGNGPKLGEINIVGLFEAEAAALLQAADRGLILHKTHNTRDSGALLESTFRQIVGSRLPPQAQMAHGYLYDLESTCTSQIDAMLLSAADNYPMMAVEGEAIYAPFTSCRAYVEIKASAREVAKQLGQVANISARIAEMASTLGPHRAGTAMPERVGSVLLYENSTGVKAKPFARWFSKNPSKPTLVVFLDKAVVISRRPILNEFFDCPGGGSQSPATLYLSDPFAGGEAWIYKPDAKTVAEARGRVFCGFTTGCCTALPSTRWSLRRKLRL